MTYSPWSQVAAMPDVTVAFVPLPDEEMAWWDPVSRTIEINRNLGRIERRTTLAHELEHVAAGDNACTGTRSDGWFTTKMEVRAATRAAKRLIPIERLAEAISLYDDDDDLVAEHLDVDLDTLDTRRMTLSPDERHYLRRRLAELEVGA